jgi:hypothetical protein
MEFVLRICSIAMFIVASVVSIHAQGVTGIISGTVTDPSKAAIPGASVNIVNAETGVTPWTGTTNSSGVYRAPALPVGRYNVTISSSGFKTQKVADVHLSADQTADISVVLQVGQTAQTVTVGGSTQGELAIDTSSLGVAVTPSQIQNLPLPSRNTLNLLALSPGVSTGNDITSQNGLNTAQLSINGSRTLKSEFLIDGVSVVTASTGGPQTLPSPDSIFEFKVLTSSYAAQYGRTSGGSSS